VGGVGRIGPILPWLDRQVRVDDVSLLESASCAYLKHVAGQGMTRAIIDQRRQRLRQGPFEPDRVLLEPDDDVDGFIGAQAETMIQQMPAGDPWTTIVSFTGPGNDLPPPSLYDGLVDAGALSGDFLPADLARMDDMVELDYPRTLIQRLEPQKIGRIRADYLGRVSLIDQAMGRILRAVTNRPDASRTWIVLASDRGVLLGEHGLVGHRSFLSPVVETPVMICPPLSARVPGELEYHEGLVSHVDVAATIASLGGCDLPLHAVGRSLLPLLAGEDTEPRVSQEACLSEAGDRLMLETRRHRVIFDTQRQIPLALYDLLNDPYERSNLVDSPIGRNLLDSLRWRVGQVLMPLRNVQAGL
jgi:arylsulfatase A-like enzyme